MRNIERDDKRYHCLMSKQECHRADKKISENVIKKYEEILNQEKIIDDLIRKWSPILDKLPDK
jgi:hypothetical protein